jgi:hypothetical protein
VTIKIPIQLAGRLKLDVRGPGGELRRSTGWFHNLVLDSGLNGIGTKNMIFQCYVGTGTAEPAVTDTALASFLAATSSITTRTPGASSSAPYYKKNTQIFRFPVGVAAGNVSEIGIASEGTPPKPLFSRALVLDGDGNPTTITVLSDEILDVTYEIRAYLPSDDWTTTVTILGNDYDVIVRTANATSVPFSGGDGPGGQVKQYGDSFAYSGTIGAVTSSPSGTQISRVTPSAQAYSNNSYQRDIFWTFPVDSSGTIQSMKWSTSYGDFQIGFSPGIPKTNTQTMPVTCRISWARKDLDA